MPAKPSSSLWTRQQMDRYWNLVPGRPDRCEHKLGQHHLPNRRLQGLCGNNPDKSRHELTSTSTQHQLRRSGSRKMRAWPADFVQVEKTNRRDGIGTLRCSRYWTATLP